MKTLSKLLILALIVSAGSMTAFAQQTKKDKKADIQAAIRNNVVGRHYTFSANYILPQRGGGKAITDTYYDLRVTADSVVAFLPYYGRAYFDVPYNGDMGMKFTSTKFAYEIKDKKKGGWEISIKPSDAKNIDRVLLNISSDGYASLSITSSNRDFITYNGYIK